MQRADVPAIKIQSMADLMNHEQVQARRNFVDVVDDGYGEVCVIAPVPRLARMPATVRFPGQRLGAATRDVLQGELDLSSEELADLRRRGIVG
jgi:succinate--hydroxymethylglutarate CoA-transferase